MDDLVKWCVRVLQLAIVQHVERDVRAAEITDTEAAHLARAIIPLVATALRQELPDEIDLFRIIRKAGRSDADKAKAVAAAIRAGDGA